MESKVKNLFEQLRKESITPGDEVNPFAHALTELVAGGGQLSFSNHTGHGGGGGGGGDS